MRANVTLVGFMPSIPHHDDGGAGSGRVDAGVARAELGPRRRGRAVVCRRRASRLSSNIRKGRPKGAGPRMRRRFIQAALSQGPAS